VFNPELHVLLRVKYYYGESMHDCREARSRINIYFQRSNSCSMPTDIRTELFALLFHSVYSCCDSSYPCNNIIIIISIIKNITLLILLFQLIFKNPYF
jgi:hypothetical protein